MTARPKIVMFNPEASPKMPYDSPPLSVLAAASMVDLDRYDVKVIDWHYENFEDRLRSECADAMVFGVTCMTGFQIGRMLEAVKLVREANPDIAIVCGGWHPTFLPEQTLGCREIDYVVMGQGQRPFKSLVEHIAEEREPTDIPGVAYRKNGGFVVNDRAPIEPPDNFPPIPYHLLDNYEDFIVHTAFGERVAYFLTSQGCPNNCNFCAEAAFYKRRWHPRPIEKVVEEIKEMKEKYNLDGVTISDSNFFVKEARVAEFCRLIKPLGIRWGGTSARSDLLARYSDETWQLMKESGLYDIFIGTESASDETLAILNKGGTVADSLKALAKAKEFGIRMQCPFIIGAPGTDIEKDFAEDMRFINRLRKNGDASQFHMFVCIPYPGTGFYEKGQEYGFTPPDTLEGWVEVNLHAQFTPWVPKKYAEITNQLSVYFMFLAGHPRKIIETTMPRSIKWLALAAERVMYTLSDFRVTHSFFRLPVEYSLIRFALLHRHWFFGKEKILF